VKAPKTLRRAVAERLGGSRPNWLRASAAAVAVGVTVYRVLRS
jgi:uncharacterized protein YjeT (DUF2065 family)